MRSHLPLSTTERAARAHYLRGLRLLRDAAPVRAAERLSQAVAVLPQHAGARVNLARAWTAAREPRRALATADAALAMLPDHAELLFLRGSALNALGQPMAARAALQRAVALNPAHAPSLLNLGNACVDLDDLDAAERHLRAALARDPALPEAHASLGFVLTARGRLPEAIDACEAAITLRQDLAQAHWNLAIACLLGGEFRRGFAAYEWRKRHGLFGRDFAPLPFPPWTGDAPAGRRILVRAEQGLGDTIQFARYLPLLATHGARPVLACDRALLSLLQTLPDTDVVPNDTFPACDASADLLSLPLLCGTRLDTIPFASGYLRADPARRRSWQARLPEGAKIGLAWAGNSAHLNDRRRSLPRAAAAELAALLGNRAVNLQVGERATEAGLPDLSPLLTDYAETASLIACLDLVVTVDTSVAHLAGALGVPCWVLLPYAPDWRWMLSRNDSPWYNAVRLFRQPTPGDWASVIDAARTALHRDAAPGSGKSRYMPHDTSRTSVLSAC